MAGTATNVMVGVATLFIAPATTPSPTFTAKTGKLAALPAAWVASGFSESGVTLNVDKKLVDIRVEEQSTPVDVVTTTTTVTIDLTFAEDTVQNMLNAYGGGSIAATVGGATIKAHTILTLADALNFVAIALTGKSPKGGTRLIYVPKLVSGGKVKTTYRRAKSPRTYPATFTAICAVTQIKISDYA